MFNIIVFNTNCLLIFIFKIFFKIYFALKLFCLKIYVCFESQSHPLSLPLHSFVRK